MATIRSGRRKRLLLTGFGSFLIFVLAFVIFFYLNFQTVSVKGNSMEPTFQNGRRVLVSQAYWLVGGIKKDDIVVLREPNSRDIVIKRVYALGGDVVDMRNIPEDWSIANGEYRVPDGKYYVIGDNKPVSEDSRRFGPVDPKDILGKVVIMRLGRTPPPPSADAKTVE